jgi:hypothetical protein
MTTIKVGVYIPTWHKQPKTANLAELRAATARPAEALAEVGEEEVVAEFKQLRRQRKDTTR